MNTYIILGGENTFIAESLKEKVAYVYNVLTYN